MKKVKPIIPLDFVDNYMIEIPIDVLGCSHETNQDEDAMMTLISSLKTAKRCQIEAKNNDGLVSRKTNERIVSALLKQLNAMRDLGVLK